VGYTFPKSLKCKKGDVVLDRAAITAESLLEAGVMIGMKGD
jgi:hypothetical protein